MRHPKGARSIGIGHPRSGDRCTKTLPYLLDPLWVAEQSLQRPRQGVAHTSQSISATPWRGRDCLLCPVHGSSGLRPSTRGYGAGTRKGCFPAAWRTVLSDGAMPYRTSRTGRTSAVPNRTGRRSLRGSYGSRQGSPLHSHRSSRDSGDDLWADRPLDLDPARASHTRGELDSATPWRGRGIACIARSTGLRGYAPRPVAMERAPTRGAPFPTLHN